MSTNEYREWIDGIRQKASQFGVIFLQVGAANKPAREALFAAGMTTMSTDEYLSTHIQDPSCILISDIERFSRARVKESLGQLRERVLADVTAGFKFILLSTAPRIAFPDVIGSSLLEDARFAHAPRIRGDDANDFPSCAQFGEDSRKVLCEVLADLGVELCASLERVLFESLLVGDEALAVFRARELEALDAAGLICIDGSMMTWNFPKWLKPLKDSLDEVLAGSVSAPSDLLAVSSGLWLIERTIRRAIRNRAIEKWGEAWRTQCLNPKMRDDVVERATEAAYLAASSIKQIRDPLEWLSLGELLTLTENPQIGKLGISSAMWGNFKVSIMPIRNRLAHMRMLRPEDSAEVAKWRTAIDARIGI